jgi:hypothetical protein
MGCDAIQPGRKVLMLLFWKNVLSQSSTLKMEAAGTSETLLDHTLYQQF